MYLLLVLVLQALWVSWCHATQHYPASWGHYDVCKSQVYAEDRLAWHYMACQPEATDMTKYLRVSLDPPNITCGDPPEMYCALVSLKQFYELLDVCQREPFNWFTITLGKTHFIAYIITWRNT